MGNVRLGCPIYSLLFKFLMNEMMESVLERPHDVSVVLTDGENLCSLV